MREVYLGECVGECAFEEPLGQVVEIWWLARKLIRWVFLG